MCSIIFVVCFGEFTYCSRAARNKSAKTRAILALLTRYINRRVRARVALVSTRLSRYRLIYTFGEREDNPRASALRYPVIPSSSLLSLFLSFPLPSRAINPLALCTARKCKLAGSGALSDLIVVGGRKCPLKRIWYLYCR